MKEILRYRSLLEISSPWAVLAILIVYTFALFLGVPYSGIRWNTSDLRITNVFVDPGPDAPLQISDRLLQVGEDRMADFQSDLWMTLFDNLRPGQAVSLLIERDGQELTIPWIFPGFNSAEFWFRLTSQWWIAYVFWLSGTLALLFIRPRDTRWLLLILFFYLAAIWLALSSGPSRWHVWGSAILLRVAVWLSLPVYLHLHWAFPQPLARLPARTWSGVYLVGIALAIAQLFQLLPHNAYLLGLFLALFGSFVFLIWHAVKGKEHRREVGFLALFLGIAVLPVIAAGLTTSILPLRPGMSASTLLAPLVALPGIPLAYFYAIFRRRLGDMEGRANRLVSLYIFLVLLVLVYFLVRLLAQTMFDAPAVSDAFGAAAIPFAGLATALGFPGFQRWAERRILGMPLAPTQLIQAYTVRIATSLDRENLIQLIRDEVLPSLLIREAALVRIEGTLSPIFTLNIQEDQLPKPGDIDALIAEAGRYRQPVLDGGEDLPCAWARLILSFSIEGKGTALCLLGRRDPDDFYAAAEVEILEALMNQTLLALQNVEQAERLHALYQDDIQRREAERLSLARELHDDVLQQLALLSQSIDERSLQAYDTSVQRIRSIIDGLRPVMLTYGLLAAFEELSDDLSGRNSASAEDRPEIRLEIPASEARYPPEVELHLFRIVQQACRNAVEHAHARQISIRGSLEPDRVNLFVDDDGVGFAAGEQLDLAGLLANRHYGLVGMYERMALIGAQIKVSSIPGAGTQVHISWNSGEKHNP